MDYEPKEIEMNTEPDTYRTGSTQPPKSRRGLIAVLLVAVILLCGAVGVLGVSNLRLLRQAERTQEDVPAVVNNPQNRELTDSTEPVNADNTQPAVPLSPSGISQPTVTQENAMSLQEIYERNIASVVSITATGYNGASTGTGVILSEEGCIVTNCHVVEDGVQLQVLLSDGRELHAEVVGLDPTSDLAVLDIDAEELYPAELGDSSVLRVGDSVVAIGDPLGVELRGSMTDGIISAINRDIVIEGRTMSLIQTNAALNSGNSGGPLINCYGQVIGINTMKMGDSMSVAGVEGSGFAIPSTTVRDVVNQILEKGYVSGRPYLGIAGESVDLFYQVYYGMPGGLYINQVDEDSSAATAGIQRGDILLSIDGVRIADNDTLRAQLYNYTPGDHVTVVIYRNGRQYQVTLTVGEVQG